MYIRTTLALPGPVIVTSQLLTWRVGVLTGWSGRVVSLMSATFHGLKVIPAGPGIAGLIRRCQNWPGWHQRRMT